MNRKIHKIAVPIVWIFIYVFTIPMPLASYVLCVGADGHIEFEAAANGQCTYAAAFKSGQLKVAFTEVASPEDHCGSCLDIPIFVSDCDQQFVVPAKSILPDLSGLPVAIITTQQTTAATIPIRISLLDFLPRINPTLISLRTITLLI